MHMSFWFGSQVDNFLFYGYDIRSGYVLALTCIGLAGLAVYFESIKIMQARLKQKELISRHRQLRALCPSASEEQLAQENDGVVYAGPTRTYRVVRFICDMMLWFNQTTFGYILMLAVMSYNAYFAISIIIGAGVGFFIFGPTLLKINVENCRVIRETFCMDVCGEPDRTLLLDPETATPSPLGPSTSAVNTVTS